MDLDKTIVPAKHTFDLGMIYGCGCARYGYDIIRMKTAARTKATWGAPESIANTDTSFIKFGDVVSGRHLHTINRNIVWVREMWLEASVNQMLGLEQCGQRHTITVGFFPFLAWTWDCFR